MSLVEGKEISTSQFNFRDSSVCTLNKSWGSPSVPRPWTVRETQRGWSTLGWNRAISVPDWWLQGPVLHEDHLRPRMHKGGPKYLVLKGRRGLPHIWENARGHWVSVPTWSLQKSGARPVCTLELWALFAKHGPQVGSAPRPRPPVTPLPAAAWPAELLGSRGTMTRLFPGGLLKIREPFFL